MLKLNKLELNSLKEYDTKKITKTKQLDISNNLLKDLEGIHVWGEDLKWLNASHNQIKGLKYLKNCLNVNVLNLSHNKITSIKHLNKLKALNALILNNNELKCLDGLSSLTELNTLILSSNNLEHVDVASLKQLQKFSASHNALKEFPLLHTQKDLKDLKLNNNKIEHVPDWFVSSCIRIKTLDLGNNTLKDVDSIKHLCNLPYLENLNLKGNPLCDLQDYHIKMKEIFPKLKILDFKKLSDLYFKAIECQAKGSQEPLVVKENINEITDTPASDVNIIPNVTTTAAAATKVTDASKGRDVCSKHGFKSKKVKRKDDDDAEQPTEENNENVLCDSTENKTSKKTSKNAAVNDNDKADAGKETEGDKHSKCNDNDSNESMATETKNSDQKTPKKKKKGKKRKHASADADDTPINVKKNKENGHATAPDDSTKGDKQTSKVKGKDKKKKGDKKGSKKTGIVGIIKTASRKKSKSFDHGDLFTLSASFGMGESDAWN